MWREVGVTSLTQLSLSLARTRRKKEDEGQQGDSMWEEDSVWGGGKKRAEKSIIQKTKKGDGLPALEKQVQKSRGGHEENERKI